MVEAVIVDGVPEIRITGLAQGMVAATIVDGRSAAGLTLWCAVTTALTGRTKGAGLTLECITVRATIGDAEVSKGITSGVGKAGATAECVKIEAEAEGRAPKTAAGLALKCVTARASVEDGGTATRLTEHCVTVKASGEGTVELTPARAIAEGRTGVGGTSLLADKAIGDSN
jgi:hypothetical protein